MGKLTIAEMDSLLVKSTNHKIQALLRRFKSIESFPNHQRDLVATHYGYKAIKYSDITYTHNTTGRKMTYKEVVAEVNKLAEGNYKVGLILSQKSSFSKVSAPQRELILNHIGITMERSSTFYFKRLKE